MTPALPASTAPMRGAIAVAAAALALVGSAVHAQALPADLDALSRRLALQADEIGALRRMLAAQEAALAESQRALQGLVIERQAARPAPVPVPATSPAAEPAPAAVAAVASKADRSDRSAEAAAEAATQAAARVAPVADQPGVLTPKGYVTAEASLQFAYSSSNRIALAGYTVVPAILVGLVDVREVKRSTYTAALATRWGAWDRVELEAKLPYVWRSDTSIGREVNQASTADTAAFGASGHGIGDAEVTARYQLNALRADEPVVVASLRAKTRTGRDPFEVTTSRNVVGFRNDGIQQQLPTGSGFNGLQPGLTVLLPSDPAVFFGGVSYLHSLARRNVVRNTDTGPEALGTIAPGGIVGFNFGMGLALNERSSFSVGYDHASIGRTRVNGQVAADSVRLQLGTLLLGYSHRTASGRSVSLSLGAGLTRDTPDLTLTLRVPMAVN